jgi:hypothetical protein
MRIPLSACTQQPAHHAQDLVCSGRRGRTRGTLMTLGLMVWAGRRLRASVGEEARRRGTVLESEGRCGVEERTVSSVGRMPTEGVRQAGDQARQVSQNAKKISQLKSGATGGRGVKRSYHS